MFAWHEWLQFLSGTRFSSAKPQEISFIQFIKCSYLHLGGKKKKNTRRNLQTTKRLTFTTTKRKQRKKQRNETYTDIYWWVSLVGSHSLCLWKRQCFMAIKGRSHVCISCCTNIVQCSAWNKARVKAADQFIPQTQASESRRNKKTGKERFESKPGWGLREGKGIQTFWWRFSSPSSSSSSSSLRWLLATNKPSERPKPPASQGFQESAGVKE